MQAWIAVGSAENFELLRERGFDLAAFKSSRRKQSSDMQPGDRIVFYLTKVVQFGHLRCLGDQSPVHGFGTAVISPLHGPRRLGRQFPGSLTKSHTAVPPECGRCKKRSHRVD